MANESEKKKDVAQEQTEEKIDSQSQGTRLGHSFETLNQETRNKEELTYENMRDDSPSVIPNT